MGVLVRMCFIASLCLPSESRLIAHQAASIVSTHLSSARVSSMANVPSFAAPSMGSCLSSWRLWRPKFMLPTLGNGIKNELEIDGVECLDMKVQGHVDL